MEIRERIERLIAERHIGIEEVDITAFLAFGSRFGSRSCMWFDRPSYILKNGTFGLVHCFWVIVYGAIIRKSRTV